MRSLEEKAKSDVRRERYERFLKGSAKQRPVEKTRGVIADAQKGESSPLDPAFISKATRYLNTRGLEDDAPDFIC